MLVSWAAGDRDDHLEPGIDQEAVLREIDAARAELDEAWRPLATRFAELAGRSDRRAMTPDADLTDAAGEACSGSASSTPTVRSRDLDRLGDAADPLLAILGRTADPDLALAGLVRLAEAADDGGRRCSSALADDEGTAMRLLSVLGVSKALADHLVRHPEQWSELTDPLLGSHPAGGVRRPRRAAARGRRRPGRRTPRSRRSPTPRRSTRCAWSTAACCCGSPPATSPTTWASTTSPPSSPTSRPAPSRRRWRSPGAGSATPASTARLAVIAMGKCGGHELNYVSDVDVDLRLRARRRAPTRPPPPGSRPSSPAT